MKKSTVVSLLCIVIFAAVAVFAYAEDSASTGVIVFGASEVASSAQDSSSAGGEEEVSGSDDGAQVVLPNLYEITGSKIGGTQVSKPVTLPSEGVIMFVDAGLSGAFTVMRVDKDGRERQVLGMNPEQAIGKKLPKGTYKVYPEDVSGEFALNKLEVMVQVSTEDTSTGEK
ncbi:MAG: hypothetical protein WC572_02690 [Candidatus Omnitrophota bacterium]|jgi:hypothetical protein